MPLEPRVTVTSLSPDSSSRLPWYVGESLAGAAQVRQAWPRPPRVRNLVSLVRTFHPVRRRWRDAYERETEHRLRTWNDFSRQLQTAPAVLDSDVILQEGLHFDSFPPDYRGTCALYLHGMLSMVLENSRFDCSMWRPPDHEIDPWLAGEKRVLARADRIFIGSQFLGPILERTYGVDPRKIVFAGTGRPPLPVDPFDGARYSRSKTILFVGKGFEMKGGEYLVRAFSDVVEKIPTARLQIVGPVKIFTPPHPNIDFIGRVHDRDRLLRLYHEAAVFAMPSLHEAFGFVFLEAMSCGLPCVGSNIFAIPEIIEHGRTGLVVEPADARQLADALLWILEHPDDAERMGEAGRRAVQSRFTWDAVGARILDNLGAARAQPATVA